MLRTRLAALFILSWGGLVLAQPAPNGARTTTVLDAECMASAVSACVVEEYRAPAYLPGQTLSTVGGTPCTQGAMAGADGQVVKYCDYNDAVHRNTTTVSACELRVRADPPPQCQQQVLTAYGAEELAREAVQAQTAALREAFFVHCRATARRREDCEPLRPQAQ